MLGCRVASRVRRSRTVRRKSPAPKQPLRKTQSCEARVENPPRQGVRNKTYRRGSWLHWARIQQGILREEKEKRERERNSIFVVSQGVLKARRESAKFAQHDVIETTSNSHLDYREIYEIKETEETSDKPRNLYDVTKLIRGNPENVGRTGERNKKKLIWHDNKTRKEFQQNGNERQLTEEEWEILYAFWQHVLFIRCRKVALILGVLGILSVGICFLLPVWFTASGG